MATPKYNLEWFRGLDKQEEEDLRNILANSTILLDRIEKIVYNMVISSEEVSVVDYDTPSWSHKQAHLNGQSNALRKVLAILRRREQDGKE